MIRKEHRGDFKHCSKCDAWRATADFQTSARTWDGLNGWCRQCVATSNRTRYCRDGKRIRAAQSAHRLANPEARKAIALRCKFGLEIEDYQRLEADQGGACAICRRNTDLHVDHDHATEKVRGLLCLSCNTALGSLGDDPERLRAAIAYLERAR